VAGPAGILFPSELEPSAMTDPAPTENIAEESIREPAHRGVPHLRLLLWSAISLVFLALVLFGTVEARIWRFNRLYFEDRKIFEVWSYEGRNLPDLSSQGLISVLYVASIVVLIAGTVLGLWYLLDEAGGTRKRATSPAHDPAEHA
jgi:hypothetical protein